MICRPPVRDTNFLAKRRVLGVLRLMLNCGVGFRMMLGSLSTLVCLATCKGVVVSDTVVVSETKTLIREPQPMAKKTYVVNQGTTSIKLFEDGKLVHVLLPGTSYESPLAGRLRIEGQCLGGASTTVLVTTEKRCACGHPVTSYGEDSAPIGGVLLY